MPSKRKVNSSKKRPEPKQNRTNPVTEESQSSSASEDPEAERIEAESDQNLNQKANNDGMPIV